LAKKMNRPLDTPDWRYMALLTEYASIANQRDAVFDVLENQWDWLTAPIELDGAGEARPE
jgi:hypothetical protein